jgi:hypothetical protein
LEFEEKEQAYYYRDSGKCGETGGQGFVLDMVVFEEEVIYHVAETPYDGTNEGEGEPGGHGELGKGLGLTVAGLRYGSHWSDKDFSALP